MSFSLGPVLANIIMTELENQVVSKLVLDNTITFYIRYVNDTLVLVKRSDVDKVMSQINSFHQNLNFTVDSFLDQKVHFLDLLTLLGKKVKFKIRYDTTKLSQFCSIKNPVPTLQTSNVVYKLSCPGCSQQYIGKTDRSLAFRLREHATRPEQPMYHHLVNRAFSLDVIAAILVLPYKRILINFFCWCS